ncbi:calponin family repeat-containing domain protein [Necator americanus]|uniref:Calponin family repeat-containing domain protein n=1 Tax=Necator americanus TaxID=51031 RepID=W2SLU5_NECAM|nr:calponin family repeat-containing domain protein [Necator americanus]ETN69697.1 calponin family repeat-containing domain protein [Necator americanus]
MQSGVSPRGIGFPVYYYPTAYQKQPNYPLSPRQAQAVQRQAPAPVFGRPLTEENQQHPPRQQQHAYQQQQHPNQHQQHRQPSPTLHSPGSVSPGSVRFGHQKRSNIPNNYLTFIAAPVGSKLYGDFPELTGDRPRSAASVGYSPVLQRKAEQHQNSAFGTFPRSFQPPKEIPEEIANRTHGEVRLQSGTNKFSSQRGMTGFGTGRDVCREGKHVNTNPADLSELPEEKIRLSDGIVRLQAGTNKYDSQKGMTLFGTNRRETTKMLDTKHPDYDHERPDQSEIPLQSGTNKFASQKGMTGFGTSRRETTKMVDSNHPEYDHEASIDQTTIPSQMGSNKYASQKGMTGFGQPRWEVLDPSISWQNRKSQGMVRLQSGTNRFASQQGMTGFGTCRNTTYEAEGGELPYEAMKISETIIPSQAGWNKGDSQKRMTSFGAPRDVKGKHLKRIWELEYPEEAEVSLDRL